MTRTLRFALLALALVACTRTVGPTDPDAPLAGEWSVTGTVEGVAGGSVGGTLSIEPLGSAPGGDFALVTNVTPGAYITGSLGEVQRVGDHVALPVMGGVSGWIQWRFSAVRQNGDLLTGDWDGIDDRGRPWRGTLLATRRP